MSDLKSGIEATIIHLVQPLPTGSSDLPGGRSSLKNCFGRAALLTPPYLVLHCEEFAWPRMSPHAPVRSYIKPLMGRTVSPITRLRRSELTSPFSNADGGSKSRLVYSLLHLSSTEASDLEIPI